MKTLVCELCNEEASLYCTSDSAFLCRNCDSKVHGINFLVARHIRHTICTKCKEFDGGNSFSINKFDSSPPICLSCSSNSDDDYLDSCSSSSSSACVSSVQSGGNSSPSAESNEIRFDLNNPKKITLLGSVIEISGEHSSFPMNFSGEESLEKMEKRSFNRRRFRDLNNGLKKAEGILVNWCKKLGLNSNSASIIRFSSHVLQMWVTKLTVLPFRVALASSFWLSLKYCGAKLLSTCQNLKRVEEISGVPVKMIVLGEAKLSLALNLNRRSNRIDDREEGWAECSG